MIKHYTDEEIVDLVKNIGDSKDSYESVADLVAQRFDQKDKQREHINARLQEAANIIGHNTISECMQYE